LFDGGRGKICDICDVLDSFLSFFDYRHFLNYFGCDCSISSGAPFQTDALQYKHKTLRIIFEKYKRKQKLQVCSTCPPHPLWICP